VTIAYIISAYKLPGQLVRLVSRLQGPTRLFFIHVDLNTSAAVYDEMVRGLAGQHNVRFLERHPCSWGDFGHVEATLKGLRQLVASGADYDYVLLLTGQDYPIKPDVLVEACFRERAGMSFMNHRTLPVAGLSEGGYERLERWHVRLGGKPRVLPPFNVGRRFWRRRIPYDLDPYFGSGYWCLHRRGVEYVIDFLRRHPRYVRFFRHVRIPDEMFFQTILMNSPLRDTIVNDDRRLIKWPGPGILTTADWDAIRFAPDLMARKFDETVDARILDDIDRVILGVAPWRARPERQAEP
jgi:hypothetical protein